MKLLRAEEKDSEIIKAFYGQQIVGGIVDYRIERPGSFFDQYRLTTKDYSTYLMLDDDGAMQGMASITFRRGYLNRVEQNIGFVTDLRVAPSRKAILMWAHLFMPALRKELHEHQCEYLFSALEQYENQAYNALIRPKNRKTHLPRYHLFRKFYNVIIFGRQPFRKPHLRTIKIEHAGIEHVEEICDYLKEKSVRRPLFYALTPDELLRRFREWPRFSAGNFLIARNHKRDIVGCMAPYNNKEVQQWVVARYHGKSEQVFQTSSLLSTFRLVKPFPDVGEPMQTKFVTHGAYDNPDIFYTLLDRAYEETTRNEFIVYQNFIGDFLTRPPWGFVWVKIPFGYYTLLNRNQPLPSFLRPNPFIPPPEFNYLFS